MIFLILGKSSSGKDSVFRKLMDADLGLKKLVGYTTRPMRTGEENGKEYFFVSEDEMRDMQLQGKIIECRSYQTVMGTWYYFTADDGQFITGSHYLMTGTLESCQKLREYFGAEQVYPVYIETTDTERFRRAMQREAKQTCPNFEETRRRYLADEKDFSEENLNACGISHRYSNNGSLEDCVNTVRKDIEGILNGIDTL